MCCSPLIVHVEILKSGNIVSFDSDVLSVLNKAVEIGLLDTNSSENILLNVKKGFKVLICCG